MSPWLLCLPIAHRGLHGLDVPENSLAAFRAAMRRGYAIEFDVRLAKADVPGVFHDAALGRMTGVAGLVAETSVEALGELRLKGSEEHVPTLAEVLRAVDGRVPLLIELKTPNGQLGRLEAAVRRALAGYRGEYAVQSFDPRTVAWFRAHAPEVPRGQLISDGIGRRLAELRFTRPDFLGCDIRRLPDRRVADTGLPVLAWTVRSAGERVRAARFADNVIFEEFRA